MSHKVSDLGLQILSDEPSLSNASLCTMLNLVDHSFRPEYTHQCLPGETYRGYCPSASAIQEKKHCLLKQNQHQHHHQDQQDFTNALLQKSHQRNSFAGHQLEVRIQLAPSCRKCRVFIDRTPISIQTEMLKTEPPLFKKPKWLEPMTDEEITSSLAKALPTIVTDTDDADGCQDDFLDEPMGIIWKEYSCRKNNDEEQDFVIAVAEGSTTVAEYHSEVQRLALWFIENADDVDISDDRSGFWKVVYLFRKHSHGSTPDRAKYSLVGYMTLFHFNAPFHKPTPGIVVRICQALVFPPYQKQGHGSQMMQCVYDIAHGTTKFQDVVVGGGRTDGPGIVQINVEDPSPGFTFLRNTFDYRFLTRFDHQSWWPANRNMVGNLNSSFVVADDVPPLSIEEPTFASLTEEEASEISSKAKIVPRQVHIVHELVHLRYVIQRHQCRKTDEEMETRFRLMVKRRLNREHQEDMAGYATKEEKKAYLAELYEEAIGPYKAWFQRDQRKNSDSIPLDVSHSNIVHKENALQ